MGPYAAGTLTPMQATEHCLRVACASQSVFTRITADRALEEARQSTERWRAGRPLGPLDGIPISWKDLFDVRGTPTTAASALLQSAAPARADAAVVALAAAAGMVCLGKTNLSEFAYSGLGLNPCFGTPVFAHEGGHDRAPGARPAALRWPWPWVRAAGHGHGHGGVRAHSRRLQRAGGLSRQQGALLPAGRVCAGAVPGHPGAAGPERGRLHGAGPRAARADRRRPCQRIPAADLRNQVFCTDLSLLDDDRVQAPVRNNLLSSLALLETRGARVERRTLRSLRAVRTLTRRHGWLGAHEAFATHRARLDDADQAARMDPRVRQRLGAARHLSPDSYRTLIAQRAPLMALFAQELGDATLVLPTTGHTAPAAAAAGRRQAVCRNQPRHAAADHARQLPGHAGRGPAQRRAAHSRPGRQACVSPTGLQLMRSRGDDDRLLRIALSVEQVLSPPPFPLIGVHDMSKEIQITFGVDVDAVGGWLGSYGGEDSPDDISRGMFAGEVGSLRLLKLFHKYGLKTTWFIPGHSAETFPEQMKAVVDAGHEIGIHGYSHENPIAMTPEQEEAVLDRSIEVITRLAGRAPTGYVAPWWEFSPVTNELLLKKGIKYDHSLMHNDFHPYYVRVGDQWTRIDYSKHPDTWMKPLCAARRHGWSRSPPTGMSTTCRR
ncbi:Glutamyl-tRNA(Gln) amidotransferase subunit A, mitochondrial [Manis javanica]|nr:Glutamyl-tRNA(Gln) amidotransferase subunit A, mitochondrial [Manis javanica]